jgi:hypothetical protein
MKLPLVLACALALSPVTAAQRTPRSDLDLMLSRYEALPAGPERDALEREIDAFAGQRYATYSRLYWYKSLDEARAAARAEHKPILSLRMLGRLDEELSCANSRFFRVALYANREIASFLRESFVLHWSSERPVPQVTIDFGDGRVLRTTLAGNSAHYVLDEDGRPIDVLPGLYTPRAFRTELEKLLPLARSSPVLDDTTRAKQIAAVHAEHDAGVDEFWNDRSTASAIPNVGGPSIAVGERITIAKAIAERPLVDRLDPRADLLAVEQGRLVHRAFDARLDESSQALFERLAPSGMSRVDLDRMRARFETSIAGDTQRNEQTLRRQIHALFTMAAHEPTFEELNAGVYTRVFLTPAHDPWLGLRSTLAFDALPEGGLVQ